MASNPALSKSHVQNNLYRDRRRASNENAAKLSPINLSASISALSGQKSSSNILVGDQASGRRGVEVESEGNGARSGGGATGRQLNSIVDDARAEVKLFIDISQFVR